MVIHINVRGSLRLMCRALIVGSICAVQLAAWAGEPSSTQMTQPPLVPWTTDFKSARELARADSLPIYLYITGSSWCIWCKKMDKEIHNQDGFRQKTIGKFHFVKIDLPAGAPPTEKVQEILDAYHVNDGVPAIIIISPEGKELARFRYEHMAPEAYADLVLKAAYP